MAGEEDRIAGWGFGAHVSTEAAPGALPIGRNAPQRPPYGLYAEQLSGTAFTVPRAENRRSWLYRLRPSAAHHPFAPFDGAPRLLSAPFDPAGLTPNRLRWDPPHAPEGSADFVEGLMTWAGDGDVAAGEGLAVHLYAATRSMIDRVFFDADGELLVIPRQGRLRLVTELGVLTVGPLEIALIPRGLRFRVELPDGAAAGYVCENYGRPFRLPELGPIGANGLASERDFRIPAAAFEDVERPVELIQKFAGRLWRARLGASPLDVVAWHGNLAPCAYDLRRFNVINTVSFDHPDPSIFTVLTAPSDTPGVANVDFVIFPPRWLVAEDTFRPPWFHRNAMSELMGLIEGVYDAKPGGFAPGGLSLHNAMSAHGPDRAAHEAATNAKLTPSKLEDTMAFMLESRRPFTPTRQALESPLLQPDYDACWAGFPKARVPS